MDDDHNGAFLKRHGLAYPVCGCYVGPGWIPLLDELVTDLVALGWDKDLQQVKQKFGGLRFYIGDGTEEIYARISQAERASFYVCEECSGPAQNRTPEGWVTSCCQACRTKEKAK